MKPILISDKKETKMIAHRGLSGIEFENSLSAFVAAGNRSYFGIETDVHRTADGKYVVIHDDETDRVSDEKMPVENSLYADLRNVSLGHAENNTVRADRRIPDLREYILVCKTYEKTAVLELKNPLAEEDLRNICDIIKDLGYLDNTVFISFHFKNLEYIRKLLPQQRLQFLCCSYSDKLLDLLTEHKIDVDILYNVLNEEIVKNFHEKGITVNCWTADNAEEAEKLIEYGVDFITSNILE